MDEIMEESPSENDTFKILIATDNHLGYGEKKPILKNDSFRAFEEILQLAVKNDVDFILLGGDLFHDSHPSSYCLYKCSELLKKYCFGEKPVSIEFLSDQSENFNHLKNPIVNYEDPNLNISIPIFSIHGNHDNPTGNQLISALDILSSNGLINYFGRWTDLSEVEIRPVLLKKGETKIAIYGLSHIPDQRLARLFSEKKVKILQVEGDDWFNILVLHQNRAERGAKNFIPFNVIPDFMDLVIWGHEHDCCIEPVRLPNGIYISQPGSSVATSLAEGESIEKQVAILKVYKDQFHMINIPLKSVRPFVFSTIDLCDPESDEYDLEHPQEQAISNVTEKIEELLEKQRKKQEESGNSLELLPLMRIMVRYQSECQIFNGIKLGHNYENRVANPIDMIKVVNLHAIKQRANKTKFHVGDEEFNDVEDWATSVEDVVERYFEHFDRGDEMKLLSVKLMTKAVSRYVDVSDLEAVKFAFDSQVNKTIEKLIEKDPEPEKDIVLECLQEIKTERLADEDKEVTQLMKEFDDPKLRKNMSTSKIDNIEIDDDECTVSQDSPKPARGKGPRGGTRSRRPRGSRAK